MKDSAEEIPFGVVAMDCATQLSFCCIPAAGWLKGNMRCSVMNHGECAHPEVIAQPRHEPELNKPREACGQVDSWQAQSYESSHGCKADNDLQCCHQAL